jgi:hypothetical protein
MDRITISSSSGMMIRQGNTYENFADTKNRNITAPHSRTDVEFKIITELFNDIT